MTVAVRLAAETLRPEAELAALMAGRTADGAVVSFVGLVRDHSAAGPVTGLFLDHYPGMTEASLEAIARDGAARFEVSAVRVVHRCGELAVGEPVVFVGVAAAHRRDAFQAADYLMDRLKSEAAFWKREDGPEGARWIEPTAADRADLERWSG